MMLKSSKTKSGKPLVSLHEVVMDMVETASFTVKLTENSVYSYEGEKVLVRAWVLEKEPNLIVNEQSRGAYAAPAPQ
jgi:hypothetical protein